MQRAPCCFLPRTVLRISQGSSLLYGQIRPRFPTVEIIAQEAHWGLEDAGFLQIGCSSVIIHAAVDLTTASSEPQEQIRPLARQRLLARRATGCRGRLLP